MPTAGVLYIFSGLPGSGKQLSRRSSRSEYLRVRMSGVADSCNPLEVTRRAWEQVALDACVKFVNIEVVCSDRNEHRQSPPPRGTVSYHEAFYVQG